MYLDKNKLGVVCVCVCLGGGGALVAQVPGPLP